MCTFKLKAFKAKLKQRNKQKPEDEAIPDISIEHDFIKKTLKLSGATMCVYATWDGRFQKTKFETVSTLIANSEPSGELLLFAMGSLTKTLIALCIYFLIERLTEDMLPSGINMNAWKTYARKYSGVLANSWDKTVFEVFNTHRNKRTLPQSKNPALGKPNPTIHQLLSHLEALPNLQRHFFAPDGSFLMSSEMFCETIGNLCNQSKDTVKGEYKYSNANYALAALLIEAVTGLCLADALDSIVLKPLGMEHTVVHRDTFDRMQKENRVATAHFVDFQDTSSPIESPTYFDDAVQLACGGVYSCAKDWAILMEFLKERQKEPGKPKKPGESGIIGQKELFWPIISSSVPVGRCAPLEDELTGGQSYDRTGIKKPYNLGTHADKFVAYSKAGAVTGYSCHQYLVPRGGYFLVVLTNSSGGLDASNHISQYLLQQELDLKPDAGLEKEIQLVHEGRKKYLSSCEVKGTELSDEEITDLVGTYEERSLPTLQKLELQSGSNKELLLQIHGGSPTNLKDEELVKYKPRLSSQMKVVRVLKDIFGLQPWEKEFGLDAGDAWIPLIFKANRSADGKVLSLQWQNIYDPEKFDGAIYKKLSS